MLKTQTPSDRLVKLVYWALSVCFIPIIIFSIEYLFKFRSGFFDLSFLPGTFLIFYCPVVCITCSVLLLILLKGKNKVVGVFFLLFTISWFVWFYSSVKNGF